MQLTFQDKQLITHLLRSYATDPNGTLYDCFECFGRKEFEDTLRVILPHHLADVSMKMAIRRCILREKQQEESYNQWADKDTAQALNIVEAM